MGAWWRICKVPSPRCSKRASFTVGLWRKARAEGKPGLLEIAARLFARCSPPEILGSLKHSESLPPPAAHRVELDRRWAAYLANPGIALSKEQFRAQVAVLRK